MHMPNITTSCAHSRIQSAKWRLCSPGSGKSKSHSAMRRMTRDADLVRLSWYKPSVITSGALAATQGRCVEDPIFKLAHLPACDSISPILSYNTTGPSRRCPRKTILGACQVSPRSAPQFQNQGDRSRIHSANWRIRRPASLAAL